MKEKKHQYRVEGHIFKFLRDARAYRKYLLCSLPSGAVVVIYESDPGLDGAARDWFPRKN